MLNTQEVSREGRDRERDLWFLYRTIDGSCWPIAETIEIHRILYILCIYTYILCISMAETLCSSKEAASH